MMNKKYQHLINTTVNYLQINRLDGNIAICTCLGCGNEYTIPCYALVRKKRQAKSCGCINPNLTLSKNSSWTGYEEITGHQFSQWKTGAKRRNIRFDIKINELWEIYLQQNKICPITQQPLFFRIRNKHFPRESNLSIDRINNNDYYHKNNILIVHKDFQKFHHTYDFELLFYYSSLILQPNIEPSNIEVKKIPQWYWNQVKSNFYKRKAITKFCISKDTALKQLIKQNYLCYYTGIPLMITETQNIVNTASIDRLNSNEDYVDNNIVWCHKNINMMKKDLSLHRFKELAEYFYNWYQLY